MSKKLKIKCETHGLVLVEVIRPDFSESDAQDWKASVSHEEGCMIQESIEEL